MGRLDMHIKDVYVKNELVEEDLVDEIDDLEPVEEEYDDEDDESVKKALKSLHPGVLQKNSRRRLEDRLEDFRLQHQINDYDFKI